MSGKERRERQFAEGVLAALRGIENQLRTVTSALSPIQQEKHADGTDDSTTGKGNLLTPLTEISVVTRTPDRETKERNDQYQQSYALQWCTLEVQKYLFYATLLAFGAAAYYGGVARRQLNTMTATLNEIHVQNVAQQRALLTVDGDPIPLRGGDIGLRIKNQGRLSAIVTKLWMKYEQIRSNSPSLFREREEEIGSSVPPEQPFILSFSPPLIPRLSNGERYYVRLDIRVFYDDGFGNIRHISPCLSYDIANDAWSQSCMSTYRIDFSKALPNDAWLAPQKK